MKRIAMAFIALVLLVASWPAAAGASPPIEDGGWFAEYYANPGLLDGAALTRFEKEIDHNWGGGGPAPGLPADRFSVRWTRTLPFQADALTFCVTVDDGVRLWVDGHLIIDQWKVQPATTYCANERLSAGPHVVQMAYFENTGDAVAKLWWSPAGGPQPTPPPPPVSGWQGQYFDNKELSGAPVLTRTDPDLRFDWGTGSPAPPIPADNFSVRWIQEASLSPGTYNFYAKHDDGVRVWVDGRLVIDFWHDQPAQTHSGKLRLEGGTHQLRVEYYEHTGLASVVVWWSVDGSEPPPPHGRPGQQIVVDNSDPSFFWGGPLKSREAASFGVGGSMYWTYNSIVNPVNYGKWTPRLPAGGNYEVFVFIPGRFATSGNVRYRILHHGQRHDRIVDQGRFNDQWVSLGTYFFDGANVEKEFVLVYDNTREPLGSRMVAFDAVKFVPR
jgi:hypothetical protein